MGNSLFPPSPTYPFQPTAASAEPVQRQYIGARYVPVFANPIEWDETRSFEPLVIVTYLGDGYISRMPVPANIQPGTEAAETYWAKISAFNYQLQELSTKIDGWDDRITTTENTANSAEQTANDALSKITNATADVDTLKTTVAEHTDKLAELDTAVDSTEKNISDLTDSVTAAENDITDLQGAVTKNETDIKALQDELGDGTGTGSVTSRLSALETDTAGLDTRVTAAETDIKALQDEIGDGTGTGSVTSRLSTLETDMTAAQGDITTLKASVSNVETENAAIKTDVAAVKEDVEALDNNYNIIDTQLTANTADIVALKTGVAQAQNAATQNAEDIENAQADISALDTRVTKNETDISSLKTSVTAAESNITTLQSSVQTISDNVSDITSNINELQTDVSGAVAKAEKAAEDASAAAETAQTASESAAGYGTRIDTLETTVGDSDSGLVKQVADLEAAVGGGDSPIATRLDALDASQETQDTKITALETAVGDASSGLVKDVADATSAAQAAQTAADAALPKSGGTMTGPIILQGTSIQPNPAVASQVVFTTTPSRACIGFRLDNVSGGLNLSTLTPDNTTQDLGEDRAKFIRGVKSPIQDRDAANKIYVDNAVATALPKSGGMLTGPLTISGQKIRATYGNVQPAVKLSVDSNDYGNIEIVSETSLSSRDVAGVQLTDSMRISGVGTPVSNNDAVNKIYCDKHVGGFYTPSDYYVSNHYGATLTESGIYFGYDFSTLTINIPSTSNLILIGCNVDKFVIVSDVTILCVFICCKLPADKPSQISVVRGTGNTQSWANNFQSV